MKQLVVILGVLFALLATGCSASSDESGAPQSAQRSALTASAAETSPATVSMPTAEFVSLGETEPLAATDTPVGDLEVIVSGDRIASAQWTTSTVDGIDGLQLSLQLDKVGTRQLAEWSTTHVGETVGLALNKHVVYSAVVPMPITDGAISLSGQEVVGIRPSLDAARQARD